jgi:hypothetical protein
MITQIDDPRITIGTTSKNNQRQPSEWKRELTEDVFHSRLDGWMMNDCECYCHHGPSSIVAVDRSNLVVIEKRSVRFAAEEQIDHRVD